MAGPDAGIADAGSEALPDVGHVPLTGLLGRRSSASTALDHAVQRVLDNLKDMDENYSAFGNVA